MSTVADREAEAKILTAIEAIGPPYSEEWGLEALPISDDGYGIVWVANGGKCGLACYVLWAQNEGISVDEENEDAPCTYDIAESIGIETDWIDGFIDGWDKVRLSRLGHTRERLRGYGIGYKLSLKVGLKKEQDEY